MHVLCSVLLCHPAVAKRMVGECNSYSMWMSARKCGGSRPDSKGSLGLRDHPGHGVIVVGKLVDHLRHMQQVQGGLAQAIKVLLEAWQEEWATGILVSSDHGPQLLFVDRIILLAAADGIRAATGCKGASGNLPCARCANVRSHSAIHSAPEGCVCITESNVSNFQLLSQARLDTILEELSKERTKKGLQDKETQLGWNFVPLCKSFLASRKLRPVMNVERIHFDPMHIYWSNGMIPQELGLWWSSIQEKSNVKISVLQEFVKMGWTASKESNSQIVRLVTEKMLKTGADYRGNVVQSMLCLCVSVCNAVHALLVCLCVQFQEEILRELLLCLGPEFDSLRALYEVQVCVSRCKYHNGSAQALERAQEKHQRLFQNAYNESWRRGLRRTLVATFRNKSEDLENCSTRSHRHGSIGHSRQMQLRVLQSFPPSAKCAC